MMECVKADKTHFLKFALMIWQHLISDAMLENEKVKILIELMTKLNTLGARR
jgi:hypothetical protein